MARVPHVSLTSVPSNRIRPAVWRVSLTTTRPVVVLPLPDSPTRARTSPRRSVRSMPSTARATIGRDVREGGQQLLRVRVAWPAKDFLDRALLGDPAGIHDQHPVTGL